MTGFEPSNVFPVLIRSLSFRSIFGCCSAFHEPFRLFIRFNINEINLTPPALFAKIKSERLKMRRKFRKSRILPKLTSCLVLAIFVFWTFVAPLGVCFCEGCACSHHISTLFAVDAVKKPDETPQAKKPCCEAKKSCCGEKKTCCADESPPSQNCCAENPATGEDPDDECNCGCADASQPVLGVMAAELVSEKNNAHAFTFSIPDVLPSPVADLDIFRCVGVLKRPGAWTAALPVRLHLFLGVMLN